MGKQTYCPPIGRWEAWEEARLIHGSSALDLILAKFSPQRPWVSTIYEELDIPLFSLPAPAKYIPFRKGVYEVAPGLRPLGTDFGNGFLDQQLFQFDDTYSRYRENKLACLVEDPRKYRLRHELDAAVEQSVVNLIIERLLEESGDLFVAHAEGIYSRLTGQIVNPRIDSLCEEISEDVAIIQSKEGRDWISYLHLCSPSHWSGESKIGKSFFEAHLPIPGFERINAVAPAMVEAMIHRGPMVRFVWGIESDERLNHHPIPPSGKDPVVWHGRQYEKGWFVRWERQTIWGLPEVNAALFVIRVGFMPSTEIEASPDLIHSLLSAIRSMSAESMDYKGTKGFLDLFSSYPS